MFGLGPATKIYIAVEGVDMRKGFDGLFGLVRDRLGQDPLSGHLFLFSNRAQKPAEGSGMGRQRTMGLRETVGEGPFPLAGSTGQGLYGDAAGRVGDAGQRTGYRRGTAAQELAAARAGGIKHFFAICVRKGSQLTRCLTYNRTYSRGLLRSPSPHRNSRARVSVGASEDPVAHRRIAAAARQDCWGRAARH